MSVIGLCNSKGELLDDHRIFTCKLNIRKFVFARLNEAAMDAKKLTESIRDVSFKNNEDSMRT